MVTKFGKDGTFPAYSCFSTMNSFRFEEIVSGNGAFQEIYKKRYAFVWVKWQISVQPLHNSGASALARQRSSIAKEIW